MTPQGLTEVLTIFEAAYNVRYKPQQVRVWAEVLRPIRDDEGKTAAIRLCRESPYPPKPADIFRLVDEAKEARRIPRFVPAALPEPSDPVVVERWRGFMRDAVTKVGKPIQ